MTVADLIAKLQELPHDMPVVTVFGHNDDIMDADGYQERWLVRGAYVYLDVADETTPGAFKAVEII